MYKTVIFDLDGTLIDSLEDLGDSLNKAILKKGFLPLGYDEYRQLVGNGMRNLCDSTLRIASERSGHGYDSRDIEDVIRAFKEIYRENLNVKTKPYDGIKSMLIDLGNKGVSLNVLSNKPDEYTKYLVKDHFPELDFRCIIGESERFLKKPDPGSAFYILEQTNSSPYETVLFGDGETDILTGIAADIQPVGVLWGFRTKEQLKKAGAQIFADDANKISEIVLG